MFVSLYNISADRPEIDSSAFLSGVLAEGQGEEGTSAAERRSLVCLFTLGRGNRFVTPTWNESRALI